MSLHDDLQNYINELQNLLKETNEETLLDKACKQWGQDDARYEVLEQFLESERFSKPAKPFVKFTSSLRRAISPPGTNGGSISGEKGKIRFGEVGFDKPAEPPASGPGNSDDSSIPNKPIK